MRLSEKAGFILILILSIVMVVAQARNHHSHSSPQASSQQSSPATSHSEVAGDAITLAQLPAEGRETFDLIKHGGPFPYPRDGVVFSNFERVLPQQSRGYYHEYTVPTPGAKNRGARRIVCGVVPECYYTADHYQSFKRIEETR
jgi:ribonuclease T1